MSLAIPLDQVRPENASLVGGKAAALARMKRDGLAVPGGLCISTEAYRRYLATTGLDLRIARELNRKPFKDMRWEELWDAALRIRNMFLTTEIPDDLHVELLSAVDRRFSDQPAVVRSSAPGEDAERTSFAGLHESFVNVRGPEAILDHVRLVWASLWSDRALLYRQELNLDVTSSSMAVVIQELAAGERSGVAFSQSPLTPEEAVIEAVYGLNQGLVDGSVQPDRWTLQRKTGLVLAHQPAERSHALFPTPGGVERQALPPEQRARPPLAEGEIEQVYRLARSLEEGLGRPQDVEWTFCGGAVYALQSRPITTGGDTDERRQWYLALTRSLENLRELRRRVEEELIPEMQRVVVELGGSDLTQVSDRELSDEIGRRGEIYQNWVDVYWSEFIPLAHGVRLFGQVYNDAVRPEDPFEFVDLLAATPMQSLRRNALLERLADMVRDDPERVDRLERGESLRADVEFFEAVEAFLTEFGGPGWRGDGSLDGHRSLFPLLLELARSGTRQKPKRSEVLQELQARFLDRFSHGRRGSAEELLELARVSYQLRDDDNIHLARIEAHLLAARSEARRRLEIGRGDATTLATALESAESEDRLDHGKDVPSEASDRDTGWEVRPRQLLGQPAGPGVATGPARVVAQPSDLFDFKRGEILVCDAVDPNMTFVVPLSAGIVERRGGMLIHGAIIAREYGLPCVTGVPEATRRIRSGDALTVDGHLGMVVHRPLRSRQSRSDRQ
jgi:pyruvate,water dikinase